MPTKLRKKRPLLNSRRGPRLKNPGKKSLGVSKADPSRTITLRRAMASQISKAFGRLKGKVVKLVLDEDAFGLRGPSVLALNCAPGQTRDADTGRCGPGVGHDVPRDSMPQIDDLEDFARWVRGQGVGVVDGETRADVLKPTQRNFRQERVDSIPDDHGKRVLTSYDNYVIDGTHRWVKEWQRDPGSFVPVTVVGLGLQDALELARRYPKARYVENAFCPTGEGGGIDPTCSPHDKGNTDPISMGVDGPGFDIPDDGKHLYHYALKSSLPGIAKSGLQPGGSSENARTGAAEDSSEYVYSFTQVDKYEFEDSVLLDTDKPAADFTLLRFKSPRDDWERDDEFVGGSSAVRAKQVIPKGSIEYLAGDKTWLPLTNLTTNFDPDQPRDPNGRWGSGGTATEVKATSFLPKNLAARVSALLDKFPGAKYVRVQAAKLNAKIVERYGRKQAMAIVASGQAISWAATGVGAALGSPVYVPSLLAMVPALAIAELHHQHQSRRSLAANESFPELSTEDIERLGRELYDELRQNWEGYRVTTNTRWKFNTSAEKLKEFRRWLETQLGDEVTGATAEEVWRKYAEAGYRKGAGRSFDDVNKAKRFLDLTPEGLAGYGGARSGFLQGMFGRPVSKEKIELLASRSFEDLKGVASDTATRMTRVLADGLVEGASPRDVARDLAAQVDVGRDRALTISRTEIIRAHAEGQLTALEQMGVAEVGVMVEWAVTDDAKLCKLCAPLEGVVLSIEDARGMLPRHPSCRCAWVPAGLGESPQGQKRGEEADAALVESGLTGNVSSQITDNGWVTLETGQHVYIGDGGEFLPSGPAASPVGPEAEVGSTKESTERHLHDLVESSRGLSGEQKESAKAALSRVVKSMTDEATSLMRSGLSGGVEFHGTTAGVTAAFRANTGMPAPDGVNAYYSHAQKKAYLNGPTSKVDAPGMGGSQVNSHGVYAHELTHAIDSGRRFSNHSDWHDAYATEIRGDVDPDTPGVKLGWGRLSEYARTDAVEGFAEFGRALYGSDVTHRGLRESFPKCYSFFKKRGLV